MIFSIGLPVVNKNWLIACHEQQKRIPLRNYLVGDAISPIDDIDDEDEEILSSQSVLHGETRDSTNRTFANCFINFFL